MINIRIVRNLAKYVWKLKDKGITANVKYKTLRKIYGRPKEKFCQLCLTEKLLIFDFEYPDMLLNDRSELFKKCRHTNNSPGVERGTWT